MAKYIRPRSNSRLGKSEREQLLREYSEHYADLAKRTPEALNVKLPRGVLDPVLDELGGRLVEEAARLAQAPGPVRTFLDQHRLPPSLEEHLPEDFRAFCLLLNGLKQWLAKEQAATDRYLLGGRAREECRRAVSVCVVTGEALGKDAELHHPVRDGRPSIYLSKEGHDRIEGQTRKVEERSASTPGPVAAADRSPIASVEGDPVLEALLPVKRKESWKQLRRGCLDHLGREPEHSPSEAVQRNARAFASRARKATGLEYEELLSWLDANRPA